MVADPVGRAFSRILVGSARHPWLVIGLVLSLTGAAVWAVVTVEPNVETDVQAGYFSTKDDTANQFRELRRVVAGLNSEIVYFELERDARFADEPVTDVTSRPALEAQDELFEYVKRRFREETGEDKVVSYTGIPYLVKLVYNAFPNGAFEIPPTDPELELAKRILYEAGGDSPFLYLSDDLRSAIIFIVYDPSGNKKETGGLINELVKEYRDLPVAPEDGKAYDLWRPEYLDSWGVQSWIYRIDESVTADSKIFIPIIFAFLAACFIALFRDLSRVFISILTLAIILTWTLALMTVGGIAIGFISMAMFPLLLGVGADYLIHIINEYAAERAEKGEHEKALAAMGPKGAMALLVATLTTLTGFVVMMTSRSPMIVEISAATIMGISFIFVLALTFIPACLTLTSRRRGVREVFRPSRLYERVARAVSGHRVIAALVLLVITGLLAAYIPKTEHVIATVEINLPSRPEKSHMLVMYERFQKQMGSTGQEFVMQSGDLTEPEAMHDVIRVHRALRTEGEDFGGSVLSLPFVVNLYEVLKDGLESAGPGLAQDVIFGGGPLEDVFPGLDADYEDDFSHVVGLSEEQLKADLDAMWEDPVWTALVRTFTDEAYSITWTLTFTEIPINEEATVDTDEAMQRVLETAAPTATDAHYFGTLTGVKRYNDYTDYWLFWNSVAALSIVVLLVALFTRSVRAVAAVALPMMLSLTWWAGLLATPLVDIDMAFVFLIPIAFITSLGSDYAVHMVLNFERTGDRRWVYRTVGKAILYSALTTVGAFFVFMQGAIRGSWEMFEACVIAIVVITVSTLLSIPLLYRLRDDGGDARGRGARDEQPPRGPRDAS